MYQRRITRPDALTPYQWDTDVTEIIPVDEFGGRADWTIGDSDPFSTDIEVLTAPELDDLNDLADEPPRLLLAPNSVPRAERTASRPRVSSTRLADGDASARRPATSAGAHRARPPAHRRVPDATGATHSRLLFAAVAAGAVASGANAAVNDSEARTDPVLIADTAASQVYIPDESGMQIIRVATTFDSAIHREELANGTAFAQERAQREARLRRPQVVFPTQGILTSGFGTRWGTLHAGLDIANAIGTPIYAASDGEVIASGPTPGFGMWVKIRDGDGTVMLYGHIDTAAVQAGQRVRAGDQIATMGNRGNSTGPHLHFEVHRNGSEKTDPMSWLRARGVPNG